MGLKEYFDGKKGLGVLSTADREGRVNSAVYARPHVIEKRKAAFIMADKLTHANLLNNPYAAYLFKEDGKGYKGKRLYLKKSGESDDVKLINDIRRSCHCPDCDGSKEKKFLVYFDIEKDLPLMLKKE